MKYSNWFGVLFLSVLINASGLYASSEGFSGEWSVLHETDVYLNEAPIKKLDIKINASRSSVNIFTDHKKNEKFTATFDFVESANRVEFNNPLLGEFLCALEQMEDMNEMVSIVLFCEFTSSEGQQEVIYFKKIK